MTAVAVALGSGSTSLPAQPSSRLLPGTPLRFELTSDLARDPNWEARLVQARDNAFVVRIVDRDRSIAARARSRNLTVHDDRPSEDSIEIEVPRVDVVAMWAGVLTPRSVAGRVASGAGWGALIGGVAVGGALLASSAASRGYGETEVVVPTTPTRSSTAVFAPSEPAILAVGCVGGALIGGVTGAVLGAFRDSFRLEWQPVHESRSRSTRVAAPAP